VISGTKNMVYTVPTGPGSSFPRCLVSLEAGKREYPISIEMPDIN
jgi:hypothetical protein